MGDPVRTDAIYAIESFHIGPVECALRADAVGAAGGGQLAWVVVAGSTPTNCSMLCPAGGHCFANVPGGAFWEEEVLHRGDDNYNGGENGQSFRYEPQKVVHASFAYYTAVAEWLETWLTDATFIFKEGFAFVTGDDPVDGWPSMPIPGGARLDQSDQSSRRSNTYEPQFSTEVKMISLDIHRHLLDLATLLDHTMAFDASSPKINVAA